MLKGYKIILKWATPWENRFMPFMNNKDADQSAYPCTARSPISFFDVGCQDSITPVDAISRIVSLASLCSWADGLSVAVSQTSEIKFSCEVAQKYVHTSEADLKSLSHFL